MFLNNHKHIILENVFNKMQTQTSVIENILNKNGKDFQYKNAKRAFKYLIALEYVITDKENEELYTLSTKGVKAYATEYFLRRNKVDAWNVIKNISTVTVAIATVYALWVASTQYNVSESEMKQIQQDLLLLKRKEPIIQQVFYIDSCLINPNKKK